MATVDEIWVCVRGRGEADGSRQLIGPIHSAEGPKTAKRLTSPEKGRGGWFLLLPDSLELGLLRPSCLWALSETLAPPGAWRLLDSDWNDTVGSPGLPLADSGPWDSSASKTHTCQCLRITLSIYTYTCCGLCSSRNPNTEVLCGPHPFTNRDTEAHRDLQTGLPLSKGASISPSLSRRGLHLLLPLVPRRVRCSTDPPAPASLTGPAHAHT